jgi:quercetin dioxygenase-like cupin family protein
LQQNKSQEAKMKKLLSRKAKLISAVAAISLVTILATTASALSNISLTLGSTQYDFGDGPIPATVQIHVFTMKPGDAIPWHFHKATSYVILKRGTLTEQHFDQQTGQCASEQVTEGSAFVEPPGLVHTVTNTGNGDAVIWWSTVFPESDGVVEFTPSFKVGGVYPVSPPNCN